MNTAFRLFSCIALFLCLAACGSAEQTQATNGADLIPREKALEIGKLAATKHDYELTKYELDTFGAELSAEKDKWLFVFNCKPTPAPPGCSFMVVVNRKSGAAEVFPGQ